MANNVRKKQTVKRKAQAAAQPVKKPVPNEKNPLNKRTAKTAKGTKIRRIDFICVFLSYFFYPKKP